MAIILLSRLGKGQSPLKKWKAILAVFSRRMGVKGQKQGQGPCDCGRIPVLQGTELKKAKSRLWKWMRRTLFLLAAMVFLLVAAKWWIVPAVVRAEAQSGLRPYFDGKVTFEDIDFNFTGPTTSEASR